MIRAIYHGVVVAESNDATQIDGYTYFPRSAVKMQLLQESDFSTRCPAKGEARYWHVQDGNEHQRMNAAFSYEEVKPDFEHMKGWIGFYCSEGDDSVHVEA